MRKLQLNVDELTVESFQTGNAGRMEGTVRGHQTEVGGPCDPYQTCVTCVAVNTCHGAFTCDGQVGCYTRNFANTCGQTCGDSCGE